MIHSEYLFSLFCPESFEMLLSDAIRNLEGIEFESIAFTGCSGAIFAGALANRLGKKMILVRKHNDCHTSLKVEGELSTKSYIIVDDFLDTGETVSRIKRDIIASRFTCKWVGTYLYQQNSFLSDGDL